MRGFIKKIISEKKGRLFSVCLFLLGLAGLLFFCQIYFLNDKADNQPLPEIFSADPADNDFYEAAFGFEKKKVNFSAPPLAMIVPHHLLAADLIAEAFSNLKAEDYETVVLISPNHFNAGEGKIISAAENWETPYGILEIDRELFSELKKNGEISDEKEIFAAEHGIRAEVSFIKKTLPEAKVLPLVLKPSLSAAEAKSLGEILWRLSRGKRILVILSADFSHYKDSATAQADDEKTLEIINNLAIDKINDAEIDTRPGLSAVMEYAELSGASFKLLRNSNSALLVGRDDIEQTTSYITGYFSADFSGQ